MVALVAPDFGVKLIGALGALGTPFASTYLHYIRALVIESHFPIIAKDAPKYPMDFLFILYRQYIENLPSIHNCYKRHLEMIKIVFLLAVLCSLNICFATETLLINEIKPEIMRRVFSDLNVITELNKLIKDRYIWEGEFIHVGNSKESTYHFTLFFEKKGSTLKMAFDYFPIEDQVKNIKTSD